MSACDIFLAFCFLYYGIGLSYYLQKEERPRLENAYFSIQQETGAKKHSQPNEDDDQYLSLHSSMKSGTGEKTNRSYNDSYYSKYKRQPSSTTENMNAPDAYHSSHSQIMESMAGSAVESALTGSNLAHEDKYSKNEVQFRDNASNVQDGSDMLRFSVSSGNTKPSNKQSIIAQMILDKTKHTSPRVSSAF
ncbi:hypothetical protein RFI_37676 [Reticulomyxa filosa]|uniref:Uncharacterized protein n=1 Tax=Reticulomyxa filosa TaxID=46433 RepID=X6LF84_RETFI|nr:hypothetical protein RFI_37676 [Reticulomyxa filosa]|eukprot:ETN99791.1 hypothetical protein RFI_37676 [Reticulomyxa filosa]